MQIEGCTPSGVAAFARDNQIDVLSVVDCSGLESLYLWSMNVVGGVTKTPKKIASCALDQTLSRLRRSPGANGVLTSWSCTANSYPYSNSYIVRVEDLAGTLLYTKALGNVGSSTSTTTKPAK